MGDSDVLQLRIHGVNNTPPVSLLYAIEREQGDDLVGFYQQRPNAEQVKAFSWGGLARTSPVDRILFGRLRAVATVGWIFVMPFGLTNVAYWSRRLTLPGEKLAAVRVTSGLTRVFALGLTLLLVSSVCAVSLDIVEGRVTTGEALPSWLGWFADLDAGDRTALLSVPPVVAVAFLWVLARSIRKRFDHASEIRPTAPAATADGVAQPKAWKFGCRSFWDNADLSSHNSFVHLAAGIALTLIWTGQFWLPQHRSFGWAVIGIAVVILVGCVFLTFRMPLATEEGKLGRTRKAFSFGFTGASLLVFVAQLFCLIWFGNAPQERQLAGLSFLPGALVFVLLVIAVSALGWRHRRRMSYVVAAVPIIFGGASLVVHQCKLVDADAMVWWDGALIGVLVVLAALWVLHVRRCKEPGRDAEAWRGTAPGILLLLALFASVLLSTMFVVVGAAFIGDGQLRITDEEQMTAPPIYLTFASVMTFVVAVLAVAGIYVVVKGFRGTDPVESNLEPTTRPTHNEMAKMSERFTWCAQRAKARRNAALAHRAEPMAAVLTLIVGTAVAGGLILALLLHNGVLTDDDWGLSRTRGWGVFLAVSLGGLILAADSGAGRPLGIVWDLICFLPRAAHPFGPPCYAQQAVPELEKYCRTWLGDPEAGSTKLVLSAHSLGGVLAVAIVLLLGEDYSRRIALLTYGCQLRAYFSRIFPELLGPRILGVTDSSPARLVKSPTFDEPPSGPEASDDDPHTVLKTLTTGDDHRWINLWRPTDYLGFPVYSRQPNNEVDWPADEVTVEQITGSAGPPIVRVDTHGDYFRARQYPVAVECLTTRLSEARPGIT